jgi:hypothetical protein
MLQKLIRTFILAFAVMIVGCVDDTTAPIVEAPVVPAGMSAKLVSSDQFTVRVQIAWQKAEDANGAANFYRHTMTADKEITDETTGPLPTLKQVDGLADTVTIKKPTPGDTVRLTSKIWSVRRNLQSLTFAEGSLVIIRADQPPPPPGSPTVDTVRIDINAAPLYAPLVKVAPKTTFNPFLPFKHEDDGSIIQVNGDTTVITIVK